MFRVSALLVALLFSVSSFGQDTFFFKKGLVINAPVRYGREALYMDELAYQLYTNALKTPSEGSLFMNDDKGQPVSWKTVTADSLNRLRGGGFGGGRGRGASYLYLSYNSNKQRTALVNIKGNSGLFFNGEPHMGDAYASGWLYIPVQLKKGLNEFYVRGAFVTASLVFNENPVTINVEDPTLPSIVLNKENDSLQAAVVIINSSGRELKNYTLKSKIAGKEMSSSLPDIPAMSSRKVIFSFNASDIKTKGQHVCELVLTDKNKIVHKNKLMIDAAEPNLPYSTTFVSNIDGSLQYYAVTPQIDPAPDNNALFLSVHGAGVEAIGQARAYKPKDWGTLVAATNRRPRGFNWEDWGRIDALEVLELAKARFRPDPKRIYLTGHSMGGHGTWFLGATYPDKWAGIAPCAGYPTLKGYGSADGLIPDSSNSAIEKILLRSSNQSDVIRLAGNYKSHGVYVFHGDADRTVSVNYARQMRKVLGEFHPDFGYYEYPGGEHWFGDHSVDWKPLFDFFKWHQQVEDTMMNSIDFTTASPGISSKMYWASVDQQISPLEYSRIKLTRNRRNNSFSGTTENVQLLKILLKDIQANTPVKISLDGLPEISYTTVSENDSIYLKKDKSQWVKGNAPGPAEKNPFRYGTFKDAFNHRMVFVYGTTGNAEENNWSLSKARFDAETWYYRGNGAVDIVSDKQFDPVKYADRGVVLFGNANSNAAYKLLLTDCPISIERGAINAGVHSWKGDDLAAYFIWPRKNSALSSVAVIAGTGIKGMRATNANQYFAGASGFPDFMIYSLDMLRGGTKHLKMAGFFDNEWKLVATGLAANP
jgi:dienelactone hydrolase